MKKNFLLIACLLLPLLASAKTEKTGITPFMLCQIWDNHGGNLLENAGYSMVADKHYEIGFDIYYAKGCTVSELPSGRLSFKATVTNGYASYVNFGATVGLCYYLSVTFLSKKGAKAFVSLLKKSGFRFARKDLYDSGIIENVWELPKSHWRVMQNGNTFYINDGPCA